MADNLKRDGDKARWTYPIMMKGEWPVLLKFSAKARRGRATSASPTSAPCSSSGKLPERITDRLPAPVG